MPDEKLDLIITKLNSMETELKEFRGEFREFKQETKERFDQVDTKLKDLDNRSEILLSDIQGVSKKLDRQIAVSRSNSAKFRELEMRVEDLEVSPPTV